MKKYLLWLGDDDAGNFWPELFEADDDNSASKLALALMRKYVVDDRHMSFIDLYEVRQVDLPKLPE